MTEQAGLLGLAPGDRLILRAGDWRNCYGWIGEYDLAAIVDRVEAGGGREFPGTGYWLVIVLKAPADQRLPLDPVDRQTPWVHIRLTAVAALKRW